MQAPRLNDMKLKGVILSIAVTAVFLPGCQNPDGTETKPGSGMLMGGGVGIHYRG
jgi:hypothetical protein